jgi:hypothetical protein
LALATTYEGVATPVSFDLPLRLHAPLFGRVGDPLGLNLDDANRGRLQQFLARISVSARWIPLVCQGIYILNPNHVSWNIIACALLGCYSQKSI